MAEPLAAHEILRLVDLDEPADLEGLEHTPGIEHVVRLELSLRWTQPRPGIVATFLRSPSFARLRELELGLCSYLPDDLLDALLAPRATPLEHLRIATRTLALSVIHDRHLRAIANSPSLAELTTLDLQSAAITNDGVAALTGATFRRRLESLIVEGSALGDDVVEIFERLDAPSLRRVWLPDLDLSPDALARLVALGDARGWYVCAPTVRLDAPRVFHYDRPWPLHVPTDDELDRAFAAALAAPSHQALRELAARALLADPDLVARRLRPDVEVVLRRWTPTTRMLGLDPIPLRAVLHHPAFTILPAAELEIETAIDARQVMEGPRYPALAMRQLQVRATGALTPLHWLALAQHFPGLQELEVRTTANGGRLSDADLETLASWSYPPLRRIDLGDNTFGRDRDPEPGLVAFAKRLPRPAAAGRTSVRFGTSLCLEEDNVFERLRSDRSPRFEPIGPPWVEMSF